MGSNIYSRVFMIIFTICSICYIGISFVVIFTIPYDLINIPVCLGFLLFFANRRGETSKLWHGTIHDSQHKNRKKFEEDILNLIKEEGVVDYS